MPNITLGIVITIVVIAAQTVFPFAFDFVSTLAVYCVGVAAGHGLRKP